MTEFFKPIEEITKRVNRLKSFIFSLDEPSGDTDFLLAPGKVEQLVREGRPPLHIGRVGSGGGDMEPWYQVPPKGFNPDDLQKVYSSMGAYVFVNKLGVQRIGSNYLLTEEQSKMVEERIDAELLRLGKTRSDMIHFE